MSYTSLGDAARFNLLQRDSGHLKSELARLTSELSTGRQSDLGRATGGDFSALSDIRRGLRLNTAFTTAISDSALAAQGRQAALARVSAEIEGYAPELLAVSASGRLADMSIRLADAPERFEQAVAAINTRLAGQSLFAADAPDQPALAPPEDILAELRTLAASAVDTADLVAQIDAWFQNPGGGYETLAWQGGDGDPPATLLAEGTKVDVAVTARDSAIREALAGLALAALASDATAPAANEAERRALIEAAAARMQQGETGLIEKRAALGAAEARIEEARVQAEATRASLEIEETRLTEADPYRTATDIEALSQRLESLYVLTARLSRLSLTEYLR